MFNVGGPEVLVILLVALIALGPSQLPEAARKVGQVMSEIRKVSTSFQRELTTAFDLEADQKPKEKPRSAGGPTDVSTEVTADTADTAHDDLADDDLTDEPAVETPADAEGTA